MTTLPEYSKYTDSIKKNLLMSDEEMYFKSDFDYNYVLEHVHLTEGNIYLEFIHKKFNDIFIKNKDFLVNLSILNDKIGKPNKYNFDNFTYCSPTNLRYIYHSFMILDMILKNNYTNVDLIEIGGGYGGLCFFINNICNIFDIKIKSYTIFDLEEPTLLQNRYLKLNSINNFKTCQLQNYELANLQKNSFLISSYAFSEISDELQKEYSEKIIDPYTNMGFLVWNFIPVYKFVNNAEIICNDEPNAKYVLYKKI